jgi:hypothetical protein
VRRVPVDRRLGVTAAAGFGAAAVACGLKPGARPDVALVVGDPGTVAAGVFTTNLVVAAPVVWSRARLAESADARVVVLNAGNANACTGPAGDAAVLATVRRAAAELGCRPEQVLVCSTGVIGLPLDVAKVTDGVAKAAVSLDRSGGLAAAEAILTTDTVAKQAGVRVPGGVTVAGMAKGAAMLAPALAPAGPGPVDRGLSLRGTPRSSGAPPWGSPDPSGGSPGPPRPLGFPGPLRAHQAPPDRSGRPSNGVEASAYSRRGMRPARNASRPASTALRMASAISAGSCARVTALASRTPSQPSSMAMAASEAVPTPASRITGTLACSRMIRRL